MMYIGLIISTIYYGLICAFGLAYSIIYKNMIYQKYDLYGWTITSIIICFINYINTLYVIYNLIKKIRIKKTIIVYIISLLLELFLLIWGIIIFNYLQNNIDIKYPIYLYVYLQILLIVLIASIFFRILFFILFSIFKKN